MRCTIAVLALAAIAVATASMAYAEPGAYKIRATLTTPGQKPHGMTYAPSDGVTPLLFKDEAACQQALLTDQVIINSIAGLSAMFSTHETPVSVVVECVPST